MPPVSEAQRRLMWAVASGKIKKKGLSRKTAQEFVKKDKGGKLPKRK